MTERLASAVATGQAAVGAVAGWFGLRERFTTTDGEEHTLTVEGSEERPEVVIRSRPMEAEAYIAEVREVHGDTPQVQRAEEALGAVIEIARAGLPSERQSDTRQQRVERFTAAMNDLALELATLASPTQLVYPEPDFRYNAWSTSDKAEAFVLNHMHHPTGSRPQVSLPGYPALERQWSHLGERWVRMHLISEKLGGEGVKGNLVNAPAAVNSGSQVRGFEVAVEALVDEPAPRLVWVFAQITGRYGRNDFPPALFSEDFWRDSSPSDFVSRIIFTSGLYVVAPNGRGWERITTPQLRADVTVPRPRFLPLSINLRTITKARLRQVFREAEVPRIFQGNRALDIAVEVAHAGGYRDISGFVTELEEALFAQHLRFVEERRLENLERFKDLTDRLIFASDGFSVTISLE